MEFSFKRFFALAKRYAAENLRLNSLYACAGLFLMPIASIGLGYGSFASLPTIFLIVFFPIAEACFIEYKKPNSRTNMILLPATTFEKYLCSILVQGILLPFGCAAIFMSGFYVGNLLFPQNAIHFGIVEAMFGGNPEGRWLPVLIYGAAICISCYASLLFKKYSLLILVGIVSVAFITYIRLWDNIYLTTFYSEEVWWPACVDVFDNTITTFWTWAFAIMIPVFLGLTYLRLKEERA